jgi:hypothetical protein
LKHCDAKTSNCAAKRLFFVRPPVSDWVYTGLELT